MLSGLTDVSLPEVSTLTETARELGAPAGLLGVGAGVAAAGACVTPAAPLASAVLPAIASTYIDEGTAAVAGAVDDRLRALADRHGEADDRRRAALAKCSRGCARVLDPLVPDDADGAAELAERDPERFQRLVHRVFESDSEELQRIEADLRRVLAADPDEDVDPEAVVRRVRDTFDVDSTQEAVRLLQMYRTFLGDLATTADESGADDPEVRETVDRLEECLDAMSAATDDVLDTLLRVELEDGQGFQQWTVGTLARKRPFERTDPRDVWGFGRLGLPELIAAEDPDHEFAVGDVETDDGRPFRRQVLDRLADGDPVVVTAGPECGKSTACKRVAHEWVDRDRGTVFYRDTDTARRPFTGVRALLAAVDEAQDIGDGVPLVVVEDATREDARAVFEAIERSLGDERDVAFLLDARTEEWERFQGETDSEVVDPEFGESPLVRLRVPELSVGTCRSAIEAFNQLPGAYYGRMGKDAERLHDQVTEQTPEDRRAYEFSTLSTELRREGLDTERTPLTDSGREAYEAVVEPVEGEIATVADVTDPTDPAATRRALVATAINLLNAAESPVEPELLLGLAFADPAVEDGTPEELRDAVRAILDLLTDGPDEGGFNRQIVRTDPETVRLTPLETRPPNWSASFLERGLEGPGDHAIRPLVTVAGAAMLSLADDPRTDVGLAGEGGERRRAALNRVLRYYADRDRVAAPADRDRYLETLAAEPAATAEDLLTGVYGWAERGLNGLEDDEPWRRDLLGPNLDALGGDDEFGSLGGDDGDGFGSLDDGGDEFGSFGDEGDALSDGVGLHAVVPVCCPPGFGADLRVRLVWGDGTETATERIEALQRERERTAGESVSPAFAEARRSAGHRTVETDEETRHYQAAIDQYEALGMDAKVVDMYLRMAASHAVSEKATAEEYYLEAVDGIDDDRRVANAYVQIADMYGSGPGEVDPEKAEEYYRKALDRAEALDEEWVASTHRKMARTYEETDLETAEEHYREAIDRYEALGDDEGVARTYELMVGAYAGPPGEAESRNLSKASECYHEAIDRYETLGDEEHVTLLYTKLGELYEGEDDETAAEYYRRVITRYEDANEERSAARTRKQLAGLYEDDPGTAAEHYRTAIDQYEALGDDRSAATTYRLLGDLYEDDPETAEKYYREAIDRYDLAGETGQVVSTHVDIADAYEETDPATATEQYRAAVAAAADVTQTLFPRRELADLAVAAGDHATAVEVAENLLADVSAAVEADDLRSYEYDSCVSETATVLEAVATAVERGATLPSGFLARATELQETASQVAQEHPRAFREDTREEYRAALEALRESAGER